MKTRVKIEALNDYGSMVGGIEREIADPTGAIIYADGFFDGVMFNGIDKAPAKVRIEIEVEFRKERGD